MNPTAHLDPTIQWSIDEAEALYAIPEWGEGYFSVNQNGEVCVSPTRDGRSISLTKLVEDLGQQNISPPLLVRFDDILRDRVAGLSEDFADAIEQHGYKNQYQLIYPIKVNQYKGVAAVVSGQAGGLKVCIEAGSKPELLAAASVGDPSMTIYCNGFKDDEFIRLALMLCKMGRRVVPIVEKIGEVDMILRIAKEIGVEPRFGVRAKLATRGSGRWQSSGGTRSKFGLTIAELTGLVDRLSRDGGLEGFHLLHFHAGSQIGDIMALKAAITEAARIYVDLRRRGAPLTHLDVGGGLGVDYDGSKSDTPSSLNYTQREYADDVVRHIKSVCDSTSTPHPVLLSESGRAVTAHHSLLVMDVVGVSSPSRSTLPDWATGGDDAAPAGPPKNSAQPIDDLWFALNRVTADSALQCLHDGKNAFDSCVALYNGGMISLDDRVAAESLYTALAGRVAKLTRHLDSMPAEIDELRTTLSDIYFVNASIFQSIPDSWAIDQLFPIVPLDRLNERPTRQAVLGDITCDSDGKIDRFVTGDGTATSIPVHPLESDKRYRVGVFMIGAYQEILGDLHNLFGDTHAVHVAVGEDGPQVRTVIRGDTNATVLGYVQYDSDQMLKQFEASIDQMDDADHLAKDQFRSAFRKVFDETTYLVV